MIKVLIVDDEPYIRQGLQILIDWEKYGFTICAEASNGKEAAELMEAQQFDLVIADIKMPQMNGLELIQYTWDNISKNIKFIILSGYYEFEYAKKAIRYNVADYILKPVQREELIRVLEEYKEEYFKQENELKMKQFTDKIVFDRHLFTLISGKFDNTSYNYVMKFLIETSQARFISIEPDTLEEEFVALAENEKTKAQNALFETLKRFLGKNWFHAFIDYTKGESAYAIGFIYVKQFAYDKKLSEKDYISRLREAIKENFVYKFSIYIGQMVDTVEQISESYKSATIAKSFHSFTSDKEIAYYDELSCKINNSKSVIDKMVMDDLIHAMEENNKDNIEDCIDRLYLSFKELVTEPQIIKINIDYLLYHLINLARELDSESDQKEIMKLISQGDFEQINERGSAKHFKRFALEFANFLSQLRQNAFRGVLAKIEKEVTEHYMDNLSLKSLSEKYYINSAYLGQIFKKQYSVSFKDYLNAYRIDRAAEFLIRNDEKIYVIASEVGYNNTDYFISKFVQLKGKTPLQYRKQFLNK